MTTGDLTPRKGDTMLIGSRRTRLVAGATIAWLIGVAWAVPALAALSLVASVCVALIAYEFFRHREGRAWIRARRGEFTLDEVRGVEARARSTTSRATSPDRDGAHDPGDAAIAEPAPQHDAP